MYNKVILVGNLTRDVELRYFSNGGGCVATIGLAVNRKYKKQDGSQGEEVCFIDCKAYGRTAEVANQYLRKGSKILVDGRLAQENWESNGQKRSKHIIQIESIEMLDSKPQNQENVTYPAPQNPAPQRDYSQYQNAPSVDMSNQNIPEINIDDSEIPF